MADVEIELRVKGGLFGDLELVADKPIVVLTGLNATGKSILLRLAYLLAGGGDSGANVARGLCEAGGVEAQLTVKAAGISCTRMLNCQHGEPRVHGKECLRAILVPDQRVALRAVLAEYWSVLERLLESVEALRSYIERLRGRAEGGDDLVEVLQVYLEDVMQPARVIRDMLVEELLLGDLAGLKASVVEELYRSLLEEYERIVEEAAEEIDRVASRHGIRVRPEDLDPLWVDVARSDGGLSVVVKDRRMGALVETRLVSSAVAAALTVKLLLYAAARASRRPMLIAIEEPEETLTPVQQLLFTRLASRLVQFSWEHGKPLILMLTTHSPYIAYGLAPAANVYYAYYDWGSRRFTLTGETPFAEYAIAEVLWMRWRIGVEE